MELYCVDLNYKSRAPSVLRRSRQRYRGRLDGQTEGEELWTRRKCRQVPWNTRQRFKVRQWMEQEKNAVLQKEGLASLTRSKALP